MKAVNECKSSHSHQRIVVIFKLKNNKTKNQLFINKTINCLAYQQIGRFLRSLFRF